MFKIGRHFTISFLLLLDPAYGYSANLCFNYRLYSEFLTNQEVSYSLDHSRMKGFPKLVKPLTYELLLAEQARLPVEEVMGITRNFTSSPVYDGSTGLFRHGDQLVIDYDFNLIRSYIRQLSVFDGKPLKPSHIEAVRQDALEMLSVNQGNYIHIAGGDLKNSTSIAKVSGKIHAEVKAKLRTYGYTVEESSAGLKIRYPETRHIKEAMQKYTETLNNMMEEGAGTEELVAFAVQELLIIHPFDNGNGRVARLIGQMIYFNRTGKTLLFPKEFHFEMNHSHQELSYILRSMQ